MREALVWESYSKKEREFLLYVICIHVIFKPVIDVLVNFTIAFGDYYV